MHSSSLREPGTRGSKCLRSTSNSPPRTVWSKREERNLIRKIDYTILPLLTIAFTALQLDRGNIANALTDNFLHDVGITQSQFNTGQQLLSTGIVLLEVPSNIVFYRLVSSNRHLGLCFLPLQILSFGLVSIFQSFIRGKRVGAFYATRLLLGLCESGFIPAGLFVITKWYRPCEWSTRFAVFFCGNILGQAVSGLLGFGLLRLRGVAGLAGWQWMWLIEGGFTVLVAIMVALLLPGFPDAPRSLVGLRWFSEEERNFLVSRLGTSEGDGQRKKKIASRELIEILLNWRMYPHLLINLCALAPTFALWSYAPSIVTSFGYGHLQANALVCIGGWILLVVNIMLGWLADKTTRRGFVVLGAISVWWCFSLGNYILAGNKSSQQSTRLVFIILATAVSNPWLAVNGSWLAFNAKSEADRSVRMALFIMAANTSGIVGSQLFRADDAPHYERAWLIIVCLISGAVVITALQIVMYWLSNNRRANRTKEEELVDNEKLLLYNF